MKPGNLTAEPLAVNIRRIGKDIIESVYKETGFNPSSL